MRKSDLLRALQTEIRRHAFSHFTEAGVTVPGCSACRKRLNTMSNFLLDKLSKLDTTGG